MDNLALLIEIFKKTGLFGTYTFTTTSLATKLGISQQTISRTLFEIEKEKFIERNASTTGVEIRYTAKGRKFIEKIYKDIEPQFKSIDSLSGRISSGLGEGKYYVRAYKKYIHKLLGFEPFEGTLNLGVNEQKLSRFISQITRLEISAFESKDRKFGPVDCYRVMCFGKQCALIKPRRTTHPSNIIELVSPHNLRKKYDLKPGDVVTISKVMET